MNTITERIERWKNRGYTEQTDFPNEYVLLINPKTQSRVRLYHDLLRDRILHKDLDVKYVKLEDINGTESH
jgi:hypothetical protein